MKHPNPFPIGPIMMVSGIVLLVITALLSPAFPWLCVVMGLGGVVLFFVGFRFLAGPMYNLCPQCRKKYYIINRHSRVLPPGSALRCPHCGTILRTDSRTII